MIESKSKLTIQINNLAALERLIGGDTEVEVDIRQSVAEGFAKKHLKTLVNEPVVGQALESVKNEILRMVGIQAGESIATFKQTWQGSITDIKLHPSILSTITAMVHTKVDDAIHVAVENALKDRTTEVIEGIVEQRVKYYTESIINEHIRRKIEKLKGQL